MREVYEDWLSRTAVDDDDLAGQHDIASDQLRSAYDEGDHARARMMTLLCVFILGRGYEAGALNPERMPKDAVVYDVWARPA